MDECYESFSKSILQLFSLVFAIIGMALIGIGAYIKIQAEHYLVFADTSYNITPFFFIIAGVGIIVTALFGFCGACKERFMHVSTLETSLQTSTHGHSTSTTRTFKFYLSAIVIIILLVEVGVGLAAYSYVLYNVSQVTLQNDMENGRVNVNYGQEGHGAWDRVQRDFECCGVTNYTDWAGVGSFTEGQTPDSCCKEVPEVGCGLDTDAATKNTQGCLMEFNKHIGHILSNIGVMGGVVIDIFVIKLISICVAWCWLSCLTAQLAFKGIQVHRFGKPFFKITEI